MVKTGEKDHVDRPSDIDVREGFKAVVQAGGGGGGGSGGRRDEKDGRVLRKATQATGLTQRSLKIRTVGRASQSKR